MKKKVLFVITMVEEDFYNLRNIKEDIKLEYPDYYSQVENIKIKERPEILNSLTVSPMKFGNVSGHWLAANILTESKVVDKPINMNILKKELEEDEYTHICVSAFLDGYENFKQCMEYLDEKYPHIIKILGNVGSNYPQFTKYFEPENVCYGDGTIFLRKLLDEPLDLQYNIPSTVGYLEMLGNENTKLPAGILTTSVGCPHKCDFCATSIIFKGKYCSYEFTEEDIYNAIKEMEQKIGSNEFLIFLGEPNSFLDKELWYKVFERFRNEEGSYGLVAPVSLDVLSNYDLEKLQNSAIRLEIANIGLESINSKEYTKLKNRNIKQQLKKFEYYGITVWGTFIIGFPNQTENDIKAEVDGFIDLDPTIPALLNLRPIRGTKLFEELEQNGKIHNDYLDIGYRFGFMTYEHKYIKKEFSTLPKLMIDFYDYIEAKTGHPIMKILELKVNQKYTNNLRDLNYVKFLYNMYDNIHAKWIDYFCQGDEEAIKYYDNRYNTIKNKLQCILV